MKKVKFTGTVNTFYCVPNCENETAILYLDVNSEQKLPDGKEESVVPARKMRFMLGEREVEILTRGKISYGDEVSIYAQENDEDEVSYSIGLINYKTSAVDAGDYVRRM